MYLYLMYLLTTIFKPGQGGVLQALHPRPRRQAHLEREAARLRRGPHAAGGQGAAVAHAHGQAAAHQRQRAGMMLFSDVLSFLSVLISGKKLTLLILSQNSRL